MLNYKNYEIEDFLKDDSFRKWTLENNASEKNFWEIWLDLYPEKLETVAKAQFVLLTGNDALGDIDDDRIRAEIQDLMNRIKNKKKGKVIHLLSNPWYAVAASVMLVVGIASLLFLRKQEGLSELISLATNNDKATKLVMEVNNSNKSKLILLPDGSSLILKSKSTVSFPEQFKDDKRELNLSGEAFFEIAKDKTKPFYIYAEGITTKVVGTSFSIKAFKNAQEVKVMVKTGVVSVSKNTNGAESELKTESETILKHDQQVVYNVKLDRMIQSDIQKKTETDFSIHQQTFEFKETPLLEVFSTLEKSYGMVIKSDSLSAVNCHLTATLGDEPFQVKLNLICQAVDAYYVQDKDVINIKVKGCK